jgi:hypothetical protein
MISDTWRSPDVGIARVRTALTIVAIGEIATLLITLAFLRSSLDETRSQAVRQTLIVLASAAALPFAYVLGTVLLRRASEAATAALTTALIYLLGFGWFAALLFLFSWGDVTLMLPASALPVQVAVAVAAFVARRAARGVRVAASGPSDFAVGVLAPLVLCVAGVLAGTASFQRAKHVQTMTPANQQAAREALRRIERCLAQRRESTGSYPAALAELAPPSGSCAPAQAAATAAHEHVYEYLPGPADEHGVRATYLACTRPDAVPDDGVLVFVSDESGVAREADATSWVDEPRTWCVKAWLGDTQGTLAALKYCLHAAARDRPQRGFPDTLHDLSVEQAACVDAIPRRLPSEPAVLALDGVSGPVTIRYLPAAARASLPVTRYTLYVDRSGADTERFDESGHRITAEAESALAAETTVGPKVDEPERQFGDTPDLPARRADCERDVGHCYDLGRELERQVRIDGGNDGRPDDLAEPARELLREANEAFARACAADDAKACDAHAGVLLSGRLVDEDVPAGAAAYARACELGYASACRRSGEILESGRRASRRVAARISSIPGGPGRPIMTSVPDESRPGVSADPARAGAVYGRACGLGDRESCIIAARVLAQRLDRPADALAIYARECERGVAFGCAAAADIVSTTPGIAGALTREEYRRRACALGSVPGCPQ